MSIATASPTQPQHPIARWAAILLGASIPISVAVDNLLLAVLLLAWLLGGLLLNSVVSVS